MVFMMCIPHLLQTQQQVAQCDECFGSCISTRCIVGSLCHKLHDLTLHVAGGLLVYLQARSRQRQRAFYISAWSVTIGSNLACSISSALGLPQDIEARHALTCRPNHRLCMMQVSPACVQQRSRVPENMWLLLVRWHQRDVLSLCRFAYDVAAHRQ